MRQGSPPRRRGATAGTIEPGTETAGTRRTFIVALVEEESGRLSGVVEAVRTHRKAKFNGVEAIGTVIAELLRAEDAERRVP